MAASPEVGCGAGSVRENVDGLCWLCEARTRSLRNKGRKASQRTEKPNTTHICCNRGCWYPILSVKLSCLFGMDILANNLEKRGRITRSRKDLSVTVRTSML